MNAVRRLYGAPWLHLAGIAASFLVAGYAAWRLFGAQPAWVAVWFIGAAVVHDLVLAPVYTLLDRAGGLRRAWPWWWNHIRYPAAFSLLLLLVWAPEITRNGTGTFRAATGLGEQVYFPRWLYVTGALFALSALWLLVRLARNRFRRPSAVEDPAR